MDAPWPQSRNVESRHAKRLLSSVGAAFAVGIGYMDPGNWATDLDAARFGTSLLWSILLSGIAAAALQTLVVRFTAASGTGLMEAISRRFPASRNALWATYALSIVATELAEFVGLVVGLQLLMGLSLPAAVVFAVAILAAMLVAGGATARRFKIVAVVTTLSIACVYAYELGILHPALGSIARGAVTPHIGSFGALLAVIGIVGATIMPHNLFLQSGFIHDALHAAPRHAREIVARQAIIATFVTLGGATLINVAIAVVGSATHATTIQATFIMLTPIAGPAAATLFGLALVAAALAASASGACAGDMICTPDAPLRLTRLRRRALAIGPAVVFLICGVSPMALLLASQIALGIALPAVVIPLVILVLGERLMKRMADRFLVAVSTVLVVATCACDGLVITSLIPRL